MASIPQHIENNQNLIQSSSGTIASMGLTHMGKKVAGVMVTPAVWLMNYSVKGSTPDKFDLGLYLMGFGGTLASGSAIGVGLVKAAVDDDMSQKLRQVQAGEDPRYAKFIQPCFNYAMSAPQINAMTIASNGGTAWKHANGLWVYITDIRGYLVNDFMPRSYVMIYRPMTPLKKGRNGRLQWEMLRK